MSEFTTDPTSFPAGAARAFTPANMPPSVPQDPKNKKFELEKVKIPDVIAREFWRNPAGKLQAGARSSEIRDKSIKALGFWVDGINALVQDEGLHKFGECIKIARNVFALWNIFIGVIAGLYWGLKNMYRIVTNEETATYNVLMKETRKHTGIVQRILAFIAEFGYFIGALTYTIGFGLCSPIKLVNSCWKDKINANAKAIGESFGMVMIANHIFVAIANICDLIRERIVLSKFVGTADDQSKEINKYYGNTIPRIGLNLTEKLCEVGVDVVTTMKVAAPAGVKLILSLIGGSVGFYRVWREMEGHNTPDPIDEIYGPSSEVAYDLRADAAA